MKKSIFTGIIGAIVGAMVGSLPWLLIYVLANYMFSILGFLIGICSLKGYQLFKGKTTKALPWIIAIVSLTVAFLNITVFAPMLFLVRDGVSASFANLGWLYDNPEFKSAVIKDAITTILFVILGLSGLIISLRRQLKEGKDIDSIEGSNKRIRANKQQEIKDYFISKEATYQENAIRIGFDSGFDNNAVDSLIKQGLLVQSGDSYYYDLHREQEIQINKKYREHKNNKMAIIVSSCVVGVIALLCIITAIGRKGEKVIPYTTSDFDIYSCKVPKDFEIMGGDNDYSVYLVPKDDLTGNSGYFYLDYLEYIEDYNFDDEVDYSREYYGTIEGLLKYNFETLQSENGYKVIRNKMTFGDCYDVLDEIFAGKYIVDVECICDDENSPILEYLQFITDSVKVKK